MNVIDNMKTVYGLPDEAFLIPCDPVVNAQVGCKMNIIDWADQMRRELDAIQSVFRKAPANGDEDNLKAYQAAWGRMIAARIALDNVLHNEEA